MSEFSSYTALNLINHFLRNNAFTPPTAIYLALFTGSAGLGNNSPSYEIGAIGAYTRATFTLGTATAMATAGTSISTADVTFATATATWGTISHAAIMDALTSGNVLMWTPLDSTKLVGNGDQFKVNATQLLVQIGTGG